MCRPVDVLRNVARVNCIKTLPFVSYSSCNFRYFFIFIFQMCQYYLTDDLRRRRRRRRTVVDSHVVLRSLGFTLLVQEDVLARAESKLEHLFFKQFHVAFRFDSLIVDVRPIGCLQVNYVRSHLRSNQSIKQSISGSIRRRDEITSKLTVRPADPSALSYPTRRN